MKKTYIINSIFEYILIILLFILSLSKGGFYKTDIIVFSLGVSLISFAHIAINLFKSIKKRYYRFDIIEILLYLLFAAYILPIIFNNYADLNSSFFEAVRYFNLFCIYSIVKKSKCKKKYIYLIIGITILQCVLSIDAVGNRYLESILTCFGSGYLDVDLTRMSGTIQYANVLAILCLVSIVFVFNFLKKAEKIFNYITWYTLMFVLITTIILTGSRAVMVLGIFSFILSLYIYRKDIFKIIFTYIPMFILVGIYSSLAYNQMLCGNIYYIFSIFVILASLAAFFTYRLYSFYISKNKDNINIKISYVIIFTLFFIILYFILAFSITKPLIIKENLRKNNEAIILEDINNEMNILKFDVVSYDSDTRYKIKLNSVNNKNIEEEIKIFNYSDNTSGKFEYKFKLNDNIKYLKMYIQCDKGSMLLENVYLNNVKQKLDYVLISRNLVYRFRDFLNGSTSANDRITYYIDALKIICNSLPNFIIGTGGEGFNNIYEQVKTIDYHSTEVHSSFLQIFLESGFLGFLVIITILICTLIKSENYYIKFAYILLVIHSCIDLNFSYMLIIAIFGILQGILGDKISVEIKSKCLNITLQLILIITTLFIVIILLKTLIAMYISIPVYDEENRDLVKQIEIVKLNEKRVMLDPCEYNYRKNLDQEYEEYLELLYKNITKETDINTCNILKEEIKNIMENMAINANQILKCNKYNYNQILYACNIYFRNINSISKLNHDINLNYINNQYIDIIKNKIRYLEIIYMNNGKILEKVSEIKKEYNI